MNEEYKISVMAAYMDGKTIEVASIGSNSWTTTERPMWNWSDFRYRVKSEDNFVPYESLEEFDDDFRNKGPYVIDKNGETKARRLILYWLINEKSGRVFFSMEGVVTSAKGLLDGFLWPDGSPCGKEVAE